jgi:Glycosyl transferase family 2
MNGASMSIAVVIPARNSRHLLGPSLAGVAAQTLPPAQVLVVDQGSADGLADWLRLRWPGVELRLVATDAGAGALLDLALAEVAAPVVAFLRPGDRWPPDHLASVAAAWAGAAPEEALIVAPHRPAPLRGGGAAPVEPPLSTQSFRTAALRVPAAATGDESLQGEIGQRLGLGSRGGRLAAGTPVLVAGDGDGLAQAVADPWAWAGVLDRALDTLPASAEATVVDLQAAGRPVGLLSLLGMALALGPRGRQVQAMTLADLAWPALESAAPGTPLFLTTSALFDLRHASDQLCAEELVRRAGGKRPVRLVARGLAPSAPAMTSRLIDAVVSHPDLELWLGDAVSCRYAASLLGPARVRLVPPPTLALARVLRDLGERRLVQPAMLGLGSTDAGPGLEARMADLESWARGFDADATRRLGLALARVLGAWRWLKAPLLRQAWAASITGWAAAHAEDATPIRTRELDVALFAALCGRRVELATADVKTRDFAATWGSALSTLGIDLAGAEPVLPAPRAA